MADLTVTTNEQTAPLPVGDVGKRSSSGWWGMLALVATEASLFAYLLFGYYYAWLHNGPGWIVEQPSLKLAGPNTVILILSSVAIWWAERSISRRSFVGQVAGLSIGIVLGIIFVVVQLVEWHNKTFTMTSSAYGSHYFIVTGFHMAHVVFGLLVLSAMLLWTVLGYFNRERHIPISVGSIYWHFVDVVWLTVFFTFYITPYLD